MSSQRVASFLLLLLAEYAAAHEAPPSSKKPNILYILLDDYGWADAGWHRPSNWTDLKTPNMDSLVQGGVDLDRHYAYKFCSPTRSAVQSGRNPIHVNVVNVDMGKHNASESLTGYAGIPPDMTGMAELMTKGGYETHAYGKWDAGMATHEQSPAGMGYQHSLFYFWHANDFWTMRTDPCTLSNGTSAQPVDLWDGDAPSNLVNDGGCSQSNQTGCTYEDELFTNRVMDAIINRDHEKPLFIFWAPHIVHVPLEVPTAYYDMFAGMQYSSYERRFYHAMTYYIDEAIGNVTQKIKDEGMWDDTLIVVHADNGGPIYAAGTAGANNYPLKGGKMSNWEGGIRVNAFAAGGFLPESVLGTKQDGMIAAWDWYATFAALAGINDPRDHRATAVGLPDIDSYNVWPLLSGQTAASPRHELVIGDADDPPNLPYSLGGSLGQTMVGGLIQGRFKVVRGNVSQSGWTGLLFPNSSASYNPSQSYQYCGNTTETGCMYDIYADPNEYTNIAEEHVQLFQHMHARMDELQKGVLNPYRGDVDPAACDAAMNVYGGHWGPWLNKSTQTLHP